MQCLPQSQYSTVVYPRQCMPQGQRGRPHVQIYGAACTQHCTQAQHEVLSKIRMLFATSTALCCAVLSCAFMSVVCTCMQAGAQVLLLNLQITLSSTFLESSACSAGPMGCCFEGLILIWRMGTCSHQEKPNLSLTIGKNNLMLTPPRLCPSLIGKVARRASHSRHLHRYAGMPFGSSTFSPS